MHGYAGRASRQYIVEYIAKSAAGFYIGEVKLTMDVVMKLLYASACTVMSMIVKAVFGL